MFEKMTDGDVMVYVKNLMEALSKLSQERHVQFWANTGSNGYFEARVGEYKVTRLKNNAPVEYNFIPIGTGEETRVSEWKYNIPLKYIRFGQAPKEES